MLICIENRPLEKRKEYYGNHIGIRIAAQTRAAGIVPHPVPGFRAGGNRAGAGSRFQGGCRFQCGTQSGRGCRSVSRCACYRCRYRHRTGAFHPRKTVRPRKCRTDASAHVRAFPQCRYRRLHGLSEQTDTDLLRGCQQGFFQRDRP